MTRPGLGARFDSRVLRPPAVAAGEAALLQQHPRCLAALQAWCQSGSAALAVAVLQPAGTAGAGASINPVAWADAFARHLDGGTRLDALPGRLAGLAWRLRIKLNEAWPGRARQPGDPWDAGWARDTAAGLQQLQSGFAPRRPTLILANGRQADTLHAGLAALAARCGGLRQPVRWLWVGDGIELPSTPAQPAARFELA